MAEKVLVYDMLLKEYFEYEPRELLQVILKCGGTLTKAETNGLEVYILDNCPPERRQENDQARTTGIV